MRPEYEELSLTEPPQALPSGGEVRHGTEDLRNITHQIFVSSSGARLTLDNSTEFLMLYAHKLPRSDDFCYVNPKEMYSCIIGGNEVIVDENTDPNVSRR